MARRSKKKKRNLLLKYTSNTLRDEAKKNSLLKFYKARADEKTARKETFSGDLTTHQPSSEFEHYKNLPKGPLDSESEEDVATYIPNLFC